MIWVWVITCTDLVGVRVSRFYGIHKDGGGGTRVNTETQFVQQLRRPPQTKNNGKKGGGREKKKKGDWSRLENRGADLTWKIEGETKRVP